MNDSVMEAVLKYHKVRASWGDIKATYDNWTNVYKHDHFQFLSLFEAQQMAQVFHFKSGDLYRCRNELMNFLSKHKQFYNDNLEIVYQRMVAAREEYNTKLAAINKLPIPFINWIPIYGGSVQASIQRNAEMEWHRRNQVAFELDGYVPPLKEKRKAKKKSDDSDFSE